MRGLLVASESLAAAVRGLHDHVRVVAPGRDVASEPAGDVGDLRRGRPAALLCVGNWIPRKGIVELVEAFALLPDDVATLHLVGDDGVDSQYRAAVRRRLGGLDDRVVVHGVVSKERIASLYRAADAFVMPSFKEPYGTVYGEAMAAGLPVVGWRAGNLPFLVEHGREGFVVEPGDVAGLADALLRLSRDSARRADMAAAASARGARLPTWEDTAAKFFESVRDLLAGA
jgi:glycosyltransferase involved in cell wall biosynthesis